ncbi:MAG TPA: NYN domain-containing protein [candidate division Zixibacteria bacterium]|nr:NYN domain-containing protein [candidate division Zixibacteria bacterium]
MTIYQHSGAARPVYNERVMIFIDGNNLYHSLKNVIGKTNLEFEKFANRLVGDRHLIRTYYYNAPLNREDDEEKHRLQQSFFDSLDSVPYLTKRFGRLEKRIIRHTLPDGTFISTPAYVEKGVDTYIVIDMLTFAFKDNYDTAILISGDEDFAVVVERVKELGKHVEVANLGGSYLLRQAADKYTLIDHNILEGIQQVY